MNDTEQWLFNTKIELTTGLWMDILIYYNLSNKELHKTKASCI